VYDAYTAKILMYRARPGIGVWYIYVRLISMSDIRVVARTASAC
jgi:hypothetical protein